MGGIDVMKHLRILPTWRGRMNACVRGSVRGSSRYWKGAQVYVGGSIRGTIQCAREDVCVCTWKRSQNPSMCVLGGEGRICVYVEVLTEPTRRGGAFVCVRGRIHVPPEGGGSVRGSSHMRGLDRCTWYAWKRRNFPHQEHKEEERETRIGRRRCLRRCGNSSLWKRV